MTELPAPRARHSPKRVAAVALVVLAGAACSSDDDGGASTSTEPAATTTVTPTTAATTTTAAPTGTTGATDVAAGEFGEDDISAITAAFQTFFGGIASTLDQKVAVLEDGETYRSMLADASTNEQFQQMSTDIREIRPGTAAECAALDAATACAVVVHDILVGEFPMAAAIESPAVEVDGAWLVGARAWCNIVEIGGASCPD